MCISEVVDISPGSIDSSLWAIQPAFHMMYSVYKLNKQSDNIQAWPTPFPILKHPIVLFLVLSVAFNPAYRFLRRQVSWSGSAISSRIFLSLLWSTQSKATVVNEAVFFFFFWNSLAFSMIQWMLSIWSLVSLPFLNPASTSGSSQFTYCWSLAWRILSMDLEHVKWVQLCAWLQSNLLQC